VSQNQQPTTNNQQPKKLSFKEQRELETIEKEMPELEKNVRNFRKTQ
jgi:ATP-binding cassette subfamily F protein uup